MTKEEIKQKIETELRIQGKSDRTISIYIFYNLSLLDHIKKDYNAINQDDIKLYLSYLIKKGCDNSTIALVRSALKYFYDSILKKNLMADIRTPKKERKIPDILTKEEIKKMIENAPNMRAKLLIEFMYSSGLRVSECASLKWQDLDLNEKIGLLKRGKGKKEIGQKASARAGAR